MSTPWFHVVGFDRLLIRVSQPATAAAFWVKQFAALVTKEDRASVTLELGHGSIVVLHNDLDLPEQMMAMDVSGLMSLYEQRAVLRLDFRSPPARGVLGLRAIVRDAFGATLLLVDRELDESSPPVTDDVDLFGESMPSSHAIDRPRLADLYEKLGRTADDLPYTSHFEALYDTYIAMFQDPKPTHAEVWRQLLTMRKAGELARLGAARSTPPVITPQERGQLTALLGDSIGRRDRLPYSLDFEAIIDAFNVGRRRHFSPHQVWRLVATLAK